MLVGLWWLGTGPAASATLYYVATNGSDTNSGTSTTEPFQTISKAASIMVAGDTCEIFSGVYRETVTPASSGTAGAPITFAAYSGESPIISGANVLSATWTPYSGSIYQAAVTNSFRQLFVDGAMMNEARWPNANVDQLLGAPRSAATAGSTNGTYLTDTNLPNLNLVGASINLIPGPTGGAFAGDTRTITNYDMANKVISWAGNVAYGLNAGNPYYVYGTLPLLDVPTEWCLATNTLYLWTPSSASPAAHTIEYKARNTAFVLDNRSYINLTGLYIFAAGVTLNNSYNCVVDDCDMRYVQHNTTADWYTTLPSQSVISGTNNVMENSTIMFSSQDGVQLDGTNNMVTNCFISQVAYYPGKYYASVNALSGQGQEIVHNSLIGSGRAIVYHPATQVEIAYNNMSGGQALTQDGGATYDWHADGMGTAIHHNWVFNSDVGIYLDQNCTNFQVYQNVLVGNTNSGLIMNSLSVSNSVVNNTIMGSRLGIYSNFTNVVTAGSQIVNNLSDAPLWHNSGISFLSNGWYPPLGADYVPVTGSGAINGGITNPPYTTGYTGTAPDVGAYWESMGKSNYWTPGANLGHGIGVLLTKVFPLPGLPATPTGVSTAVTATQNTLTWTTSASAVSYNVKRSLSSGGPYTTLASVTNQSTSYLDAGLTPNQTYYYVVSAVNGAGESDNSVQAAVTTTTVPSPWLNGDFGTVGVSGGAGYLGGTFSLNGAGNLLDQGDAGQYVYQPMSGDGIIIARLANEGGTSTVAAGLEIRATLATGADMAAVILTPSEIGEFATRTATGSWPVLEVSPNPTVAPTWLKLVRSGNVFSAYLSPNGLAWTQVGASTTLSSMPTSAYVGLAVSSGNTTALTTATFDNVSVLLTPWISQDIGATGLAGWGTYNLTNTFSVSGAGIDIYAAADTFQYTYQPMTNDGSIVARITGNQGKGGIMIRDQLTTNSPTATIILSNGAAFGTRLTNGATMAWQSVASITPPEWLKLTRASSNFSAYLSPDGVTWTQMGTTIPITMTNNVYVGFAACSKNTTKVTTSTFDNVTVNALTNPPRSPSVQEAPQEGHQ